MGSDGTFIHVFVFVGSSTFLLSIPLPLLLVPILHLLKLPHVPCILSHLSLLPQGLFPVLVAGPLSLENY